MPIIGPFTLIEKALAKLDFIVLRESETVAAELRKNLSKQAKKMQFEELAWKEMQRIIGDLMGLQERLRIAESGGLVGHNNLILAEKKIEDLDTDLKTASKYIKDAISMDEQEKRLAKDAAEKLARIHSQLSARAAAAREQMAREKAREAEKAARKK